jgi:hypothetical protein
MSENVKEARTIKKKKDDNSLPGFRNEVLDA